MTPHQILSILVYTSITRLVVTLGLAAYASLNRTCPGFGFWLAGCGVGILTILAAMIRVWALGPSVLLTNLGLTLSALLFLDGTLRFLRRGPLDRRWYGLVPLSLAVVGLLYYGVDWILARTWWGALNGGALAAAVALAWFRAERSEGRPLYRAASLLFLAYACALLLRALAWSFGNLPLGLLEGGTREGLFLLVLGVLDLGSQVFYLMANSQRLEEDLQASHADLERSLMELHRATSQVELLSGILPLCSSCKQIQDGDDEWVPVDQYVRHRTDAEFSHGLCPDCLVRLYPDFRS